MIFKFMKKVILFLLLAVFSLLGCEKDDICSASTSTTPRLVIQFYDSTNPSVLKNVSDLKVIAEGMTEAIDFNGNGNTVSIPLKTTENSTSYQFILNSTSSTFKNVDAIRFDYSRENVYVSRACGYKTLFNLDPIIPYTHTDSAQADGFWITAITVEKKSIDNENETHVKLYF
jgi:ABC-type oligopeptide transport system substrate-binding subunit